VSDEKLDQLIANLQRLWQDERDRVLVANAIRELNSRYDLNKKTASEPGVAEIIMQMLGRLAHAYAKLIDVENERILDIACGSNTSRAPSGLYIDTPFGEMTFGRASKGYTAQFEPWFCRILYELGAQPVGVDLGDLDREVFEHYRVDLGKTGALDFLPDRSFDAVQDSRLFGSPEFTSRFPNYVDHARVAQEIWRQEQRLLKADGIVIHSDAIAILR
jgi:hypothetical protein